MNADDLADAATPAAVAAVAAHKFGALTRDPDPHGEPADAEVGSAILQAVHWRTKEVPQLEGAVDDLAQRPDDPDAVAELRLQLTKALEADAELARVVGGLVEGGIAAVAAAVGDTGDAEESGKAGTAAADGEHKDDGDSGADDSAQ